MELKNMPDFRKLCFIYKDYARCDLLFKTNFFRLKILLIKITQL